MNAPRSLAHAIAITCIVASASAFAATHVTGLSVRAARSEPRAFGGAGVTRGALVTTFKYLVSVDNTGQTFQRPAFPSLTDPPPDCSPAGAGYPASCAWTSIAGAPSYSPIYTQGDQSDFPLGFDLPPGRYLISVLAEGYKLGGVHLTVPFTGSGVIDVSLQPTPLPTATIQAAVFQDTAPVNGAPDLPAERGLAGFQGHIADYIGEVTTDVFGNPLCTDYERDAAGQVILAAPDFEPTPLAGTGGLCLSQCYVVANGDDVGTVNPGPNGVCPIDTTGLTTTREGRPVPAGAVIEGKLKIPNLGPNRYALSITPPDGTRWAQTTTLEGNLDWDSWVMEGATGLDTEFVVAGEPFPAVIFGYVPATLPPTSGAATITGVIDSVHMYFPGKGGLGGLLGSQTLGLDGLSLDGPISRPWVALSDLTNGDVAIFVGQGDAQGHFTIPNVPAGTYTLTWWDPDLNHILDLVNVTVGEGETVDMGVLPLAGWWMKINGYVFNDTNRNGVRDPGEAGMAGFPVVLKKRENSVMDRGATLVTTDSTGYYEMVNAYPMTQWLVVEAYSDSVYTTGVTWQTDNQPTPTTVLGAGVDVGVLPIIGLSGRLDWGVHAYDPTGANGVDPRNGGIVGTVSYDTTRNELDPRYAAVEDWQPGIADLVVNLYQPVPCTTHAGTPCDATHRYELASDGSFAKGKLVNSTPTETWKRPTGCTARDVNGLALTHGVDEQVLPLAPDAECLEGPLLAAQFETGFSTLDGNYGFGDGCFEPGGFNPATGACANGNPPTPLVAGDYLVAIEVPRDARGRPKFQVTREEDINIFDGDQWVPQLPPPECAGALHTVDVAGVGTDGYGPKSLANGLVVAASTPVDNPNFAAAGGSIFEGTTRPLCDVKLVRVSNGRSVAPTFNFFTAVPLPGRFWGLIVDDLNLSYNPKSLLYGEKAGVPFAPVGIYDFDDQLITTVESDFNGLFDVLLPSTNRISCPTPSGVCANLYRFVGNDPGVPGRLNVNYKPGFRTIAAEFEAFPGLLVPADLAPTQMTVTLQPIGGQAHTVSCALNDPASPTAPAIPELFVTSRVYVTNAPATRTLTLTGQGFGDTAGTVLIGATPAVITSWSDRQIVLRVATATPTGPQQLTIVNRNGQRSINGVTVHVLGGTYQPQLFEVGPMRTYPTIQSAIDAVETRPAAFKALIVVYPGTPDLSRPRLNPRGAYYENLIINQPLKLQGMGPGGVYPDGRAIGGSIIDGAAFGGDSALADAWRAHMAGLTVVGNQTVFEGPVITVTAQSTGAFESGGRQQSGDRHFASIDGFDVRGGDLQGFPGTLGQTPAGQAPNAITQGGAIYVNAWARRLQITNNLIENNSGAYGVVRIGTPHLPDPDSHNEDLRIANNRLIHNGGTNLAGAVGIFGGADRFVFEGNDLCGNFSAEYGGGLTVYGRSPGGRIEHNRVAYNQSYDEGGGVMIAGELPANPAALSPGTGRLTITNNLIQANLANDDGAGLRFLMAGNSLIEVTNNLIVNNVSTHEGGGIAIDDTPALQIVNNTVMKNLTTATAATSNGMAAPAGLSTGQNSAQLQATLPVGAPSFSNPVLFNNIFWDNRAGSRVGRTVVGLGAPGDATPIFHWDLGAADGSGFLSPTHSVLQTSLGAMPSPTNLSVDPQVRATFDVSISLQAWRGGPQFIGAILVGADVPATLMGDYHLTPTSPARNAGATSKTVGLQTITAPAADIDEQPRVAPYDIGADEVP